ncbi:MAG: SPFH domain-containing protein [Clostridia bacterium]|nr:SPFH domain-containing protein [Clostridia bacterium]
MGLFSKKVGVADVIRCDEPSYLVWKWRPNGTELHEHKRENTIRWGSMLRVKEGEVAVFVYNQRNGEIQDFIEGPFDEKLRTANLPILSGIIGLAYNGDSPFQAEVYFINLAREIQVKFAVPYFDVFDPRLADFGVPTAVRGTINFQINDYREFIKIHRLINFSLNDFQLQVRDVAAKHIKSIVGNAPYDANIPVAQLERRILEISDMAEQRLRERLVTDFGVTLTALDIASIEIDKASDGYKQLMAVTKDITTATIQAQTAANLEHYAEGLRIQREEGQYAQRKQTQSAHLGAYQIESQAAVGIAGAEALGQMGANGAGGVDMSAGAGFNPAAMMAGMTLGGAIGQNIAGAMNNAMQGAPVPPPVPNTVYYVAVNGQSTGPYDRTILAQMVQNGTLNAGSMVWTQGMADWAQAGTLAELQVLFSQVPPPPPIG